MKVPDREPKIFCSIRGKINLETNNDLDYESYYPPIYINEYDVTETLLDAHPSKIIVEKSKSLNLINFIKTEIINGCSIISFRMVRVIESNDLFDNDAIKTAWCLDNVGYGKNLELSGKYNVAYKKFDIDNQSLYQSILDTLMIGHDNYVYIEIYAW